MAICKGDILLWSSLRANCHLPASPRVLEIGEANWYGDVDPETVPELGPPALDVFRDPFWIAKAFYLNVLGYSEIVAIDMSGTDAALRLDLNEGLFDQETSAPWTKFTQGFDITINTGTTEHVFNQYQAFRTIHDWTKPGGLMVHSFPIAGWKDHGFYTYQPCLLEDLAFANRYELLYRGETEMDLGTQCHLAWRKTADEAFKAPQQRRR